ncbi:response regulator [Calothrix sp. PCC 6303]|uniref:response regulator n=1 Tax=Calothrix sp. PCC 6303 TaxID=1170562 RepID=UPI0002A01B20|nr:response regulator [Calothrix sp. PCC 6303]AFZ01196.1 response regulator receiver modulated diguanylate cyclase [Calothrix sp. PCC 6303]
MRILLIDGDEIFSNLLKSRLSEQNYIVDSATDGHKGWQFIEAYNYDLIVLDVILPKLDGISFCRQLRAKGVRASILLLTARDTSSDRIMGLDAGADDYVIKSISLPELAAIIRALLRRKSPILSSVIVWGNLKLDPIQNEISYINIKLNLTTKEYYLLELLMKNSNKIHSKSSILSQVWSLEDEVPSGDTLRTLIKRLRQKLKLVGATDLIETVYSLGYRLNPALEKKVPNQYHCSPLEKNDQTITKSHKNTKIKKIYYKIIENLDVVEKYLQDIFENKQISNKLEKIKCNINDIIEYLSIINLDVAYKLALELEENIQTIIQRKTCLLVDEYTLVYNLVKEIRLLLLSANNSSFPEANKINYKYQKASLEPITQILIVGNNQALYDRISTEAESQGIISVIANDTELGLKKVKDTSPHLIILDISGSNVIDEALCFIDNVSVFSDSTPILVLMNDTNSINRLVLARRKVRGFLEQPLTAQSILENIIQVINSKKKKEAKILILDDDHLILRFTQILLEPWGLQISTLINPLQFWEQLENITPDLLILDIQMPDINGIELCQMIRNNSKWAWMPILILTGDRNPETIQNVFAAGADDFVSKPVIAPELVTRVLNRLERSRLLRERAEIDPLTGLFNRHRSSVDLERLLHLAKQYQQPFCLAVLSIDNLVQINRNYGHQIGDKILRQLAYTLQKELRNEDIIARWDGAEFVIGMYGMTRNDGVEWFAEIIELMQILESSMPHSEKMQMILSAGVTDYPNDANDIQGLYQVATKALDKAKKNGGNRVFSSNWQPLISQAITVFDIILLHHDSGFATSIMKALSIRGYHACWLQDKDNIFRNLAGQNPTLYGKVILLEDNLSNASGLEVLESFKKYKITQRSKVFWLSHKSLNQTIELEQAMSLGCFEYINVPCNISSFMQQINQAFS